MARIIWSRLFTVPLSYIFRVFLVFKVSDIYQEIVFHFNFPFIWRAPFYVLPKLPSSKLKRATANDMYNPLFHLTSYMCWTMLLDEFLFGLVDFLVPIVSESSRNKICKGERSRRMWTPKEEDILAATLLELIATGWKSDNGFRVGYLSKMGDSLRAEFPNTDLKGTPHINSKISAWKKNYGCLRSILSRSGVVWNNHGDHKIDCSDDQWDQIVSVRTDGHTYPNPCSQHSPSAQPSIPGVMGESRQPKFQ